MKIVRNKIHTIKATIGEAIIAVTKSIIAKSKNIEKPQPIIIEIKLTVILILSKKYLNISFIFFLPFCNVTDLQGVKF